MKYYEVGIAKNVSRESKKHIFLYCLLLNIPFVLFVG